MYCILSPFLHTFTNHSQSNEKESQVDKGLRGEKKGAEDTSCHRLLSVSVLGINFLANDTKSLKFRGK